MLSHAMGKRRKLNIIQNDGQSQAKEQSIESSTKVNQNNNSILEENAQFEGDKKKTRGYTHMLDVWDFPDGEFILIEIDHWGNPMGWEGKTLLNAIGSLSKFRFVPELTEQTKKILIDDMSLRSLQKKC
ncbi:hypothetical protein HKD37_10G028288 [Glycine soja]